MLKNHSKYGDNIGYGRFKLRLPVLRLGFWQWAFHSRSVMARAFIWHQKVKFANMQLPNVMLKDREEHSIWIQSCLCSSVQYCTCGDRCPESLLAWAICCILRRRSGASPDGRIADLPSCGRNICILWERTWLGFGTRGTSSPRPGWSLLVETWPTFWYSGCGRPGNWQLSLRSVFWEKTLVMDFFSQGKSGFLGWAIFRLSQTNFWAELTIFRLILRPFLGEIF